ncbi:MAG: hypothetical protein HYW80_00245, partial [Parcubacteria group bacterium]|nr:hypothetical protein [Parcubacteria group bacterium]
MFKAPRWAQRASRVGVCAAAVLVVGLPFFVSGEAYPGGTLLRADNDFKIYAVHHGKKRWLKSGAIFDASGFQWKNIKVVAREE